MGCLTDWLTVCYLRAFQKRCYANKPMSNNNPTMDHGVSAYFSNYVTSQSGVEGLVGSQVTLTKQSTEPLSPGLRQVQAQADSV